MPGTGPEIQNGIDSETLDIAKSVQLLMERGLLVVRRDEQGRPQGTDYQLPRGLLPRDIEDLFIDYSSWVNRHEEALEMAKHPEIDTVALNTALRVFDTARSRRHNALAARLKETLGLDWEHEKVRKFVASLTRSLLDPLIGSGTLEPSERDIVDIAKGLVRLLASPYRWPKA